MNTTRRCIFYDLSELSVETRFQKYLIISFITDSKRTENIKRLSGLVTLNVIRNHIAANEHINVQTTKQTTKKYKTRKDKTNTG